MLEMKPNKRHTNPSQPESPHSNCIQPREIHRPTMGFSAFQFKVVGVITIFTRKKFFWPLSTITIILFN
jgi:hypothetical protein